jgi:outer membrane protein assembly factor BamB
MQPLIIGTNGKVVGIDPLDGSIRWTTVLSTGGFISATSGEDVTVLVRGDIVFAGGAGHIFCLDAESGNILWHNPLKGLGNNDISMAMDGVSVQFLQKVSKQNST